MQRIRSRLRSSASLLAPAGFAPATLNLEFTGLNQTLDSRITFTRASTGRFTGSDGLIQSAAINTPRFDYDPVTLVSKGLLIEEQRTNLLLRSEEFDNASWVKSAASITANAVASPDGTTNADKLVEDTANAPHFVRQNVVGVIGTSYTSTVFVKAAERTAATISHFDGAAFCGVSIDLSTGVLSAPPSDLGMTNALSTSTVSAFGNGWYRVSVQRTQVTSTTLQTRVTTQNGSNGSYTGDGTSGVYVWGAQIEAGAFATSYIPTVAATVTRSADIATMTGTNFSSWYNQSEGTLVTQSSNFSTASFPVVVAINDGTASNRINHISSTTSANRMSVSTGGVVQAEFTFSNYVTNTIVSEALALKANDFAGTANAATVGTDTSGTMPTVTQMQLGLQTGGLNALNGHIRYISYYRTRLPNSTLQALTS